VELRKTAVLIGTDLQIVVSGPI